MEKVGVKKEASEDFSQLRIIVVAVEEVTAATRQEERSNFVMIFSCNYVQGPSYERRVGTFGVSIVS